MCIRDRIRSPLFLTLIQLTTAAVLGWILAPVLELSLIHISLIGKAVMESDIIISLTHFKGHEATGFGGAFKNIGMGCGSRAGKKDMHSTGKPSVDQEKCIGCGTCVKNCAHNGISVTDRKASVNHDNCAGCARCIGVCPVEAILPGDEMFDVLNKKIAEYSYAVLKRCV